MCSSLLVYIAQSKIPSFSSAFCYHLCNLRAIKGMLHYITISVWLVSENRGNLQLCSKWSLLNLIGLTAPFGMDFLCASTLKNITIRSLPIETEMVRTAAVPKAVLQTPQLGLCTYSRVKACSEHCFSIKQSYKLITVKRHSCSTICDSIK